MKMPVPVDVPRPDPVVQARRLEALRDDPDKLREAAKGFEALLLVEILRPLEDSAGGLLDGGLGSRFARGQFHEAIVEKIADSGGIGLADMVATQLGRAGAASAYGAPAPGRLTWPVRHIAPDSVCSGFGMRADPFTGQQRMHQGIDIDAAEGTPVFPSLEGEVVFAGDRGGYGKVVIVEHGDGLQTRYAHLQQVDVEVGEWLDGGSHLGSVGSTGRSTGPHLHLEVRQGGVPMNPAALLGGR